MTKLLLLKLGATIAVSAAGYFAAKLRPRRSPASFIPTEVAGLQAGLDLIALDDGAAAAAVAAACGVGNCLEDELCLLRNEEALAQIINGTFNSLSETISCDPEEEKQSMLPQVDELVSNQVNPIELVPEATETTKIGEERSSMEKEITHLKNMISCLEERERSLEIKLLHYHGLRDQEATLREFENRFKINAVESRLLSMKVETLQTENKQLKSQAAEYSKASADLEEARTKVELLKRKLRAEGEKAKKNIASLQQRIKALEEDGSGGKNMRNLEEEIASLRMVNSQLSEENLELRKKLKSRELRDSSAVDVLREAEKSDEVTRLREAKNQLIKEMEQLQTDRCTDLEELVYLRWINACLRYELRNFQNPNGRGMARDLSKSLSPKSEEKAKRLILEYANSGTDDRGISLIDFDSDCYSSPSQSSNDDYDDASFATTSTIKNSRSSRSKFLSTLKKIVLGTPASRGKSERRASLSSSASLDFGHRNIPRHFSDTPALSKLESDAVKRRQRRKSDIVMRLNGVNDDDEDIPADLKKFAKALERSDVRRRAASFSFRG